MSFFSSIGHAVGGLGNLAGGLIKAPFAVLNTMSGHQAGQQARDAANRGVQFDIDRYNELKGFEQPYMQAGNQATASLQNLLGLSGSGPGHGSLMQGYNQNQYGAAPGQFNPTPFKQFTLDDFYHNSPAYKFQKQQGMQGVLNGGASNQGALSGAAAKDLIGFNQGMANTAWDNAFNQNMAGQQQRYAQQAGQYGTNLNRYLGLNEMGFNQYNTQQNNIYQRLLGLSGMGEGAAAHLGGVGTDLGKDSAQGIQNAGAAQAWGTNNMGNFITKGISSILGMF